MKPADIEALQLVLDELRIRLGRAEEEASQARAEAGLAREEVLRLRDEVASAQRDQQDLRSTRARLRKIHERPLLARILNHR